MCFFFFFLVYALFHFLYMIACHPLPFLLLASLFRLNFIIVCWIARSLSKITATAQTLLVALLVPAEGSTHACAQRAVIRVVWFWPVLSIRVPLLHLLLGWNVPWCIGGMLIYQEVSPWRSGALWRSFIIIFFCVCGSHSFNHCSRHLPGPWKKHD